MEKKFFEKHPVATLSLFFVLLLLLLFALVETYLHLGTKVSKELVESYSVAPHITIRKPDQTVRASGSCYKVDRIRINSVGFRDNPWRAEEGAFRIGLLGDSFMEGLQVEEGHYCAALMEQATGKEVLNVSRGGLSNADEVAFFEKFLLPLKPPLVVLFIFYENDIQANDIDGLKYEGAAITPAAYRIENGRITLPSDQGAWMELRSFLRANCVLCAHLYSAYHRFKMNLEKQETDTAVRDVPERWFVYLENEPSGFREKWAATEKAIQRLDRMVREYGGTLAISTVPGYVAVADDPKAIYREYSGQQKVPDDFNPLFPVEKLREITGRLQVPFFPMEDAFIRYRSAFGLGEPYFYYTCNWHWNPLGHFLAANALSLELMEAGLLPDDGAADRERIRRNLSLPPREILGDAGYEAIFRNGFFDGDTPIPGLLPSDR